MKRALGAWRSPSLVALAALALLVVVWEAHAVGAALIAAPLSQQAVLTAVKNHITNWPEFAAANNLSGWGADAAVPPCLYTGVTCDADGALQSIALQCPRCTVQAEGTLAPEVAKSVTLATLNLQYNKLAGPLPLEYGSLGAFPNLLHLLVSYNRLTGSIPDEWSRPESFPRMTLLGLSSNRLTGILPDDLLMPSLLILRASDNSFSGSLPAGWGSNTSMPQLRVASLQDNMLTGPLPAAWGNVGVMTYLEEMYLQDNQLTGGLPADWGATDGEGMPALRVLNVSNNPLGGTLPSEWSWPPALPAATTLVLSNTGLEGSLPSSWACTNSANCSLQQLQTLWLDGNNISGPVPASWSSLSSLQAVFVRPGNELMCKPSSLTVPFKICDARGVQCPDDASAGRCSATTDCQTPVDLANCSASEYPDTAGTDGAGSTGGGSSNIGAIVGGVVGGLAAVLAAAAAVLLHRRRQRKRKRKRELPFYGGDVDSSSDTLVSARHSMQPQSFTPNPATGDYSGHGIIASPFAAMAAELGPPATSNTPSEYPQPQRSNTSAGSFFTMMMGRDRAPGEDEEGDADRELEAEMNRLMDVEMAAIDGTPSHSGRRIGSLRESPNTANTRSHRSYSRRLAQPSKEGSASSETLQWEDSVPLSDWLITPSEIQVAKRPDGSDWELGAGGFGKVYKALRHGAQPVAVKVLAPVAGASSYQSQEDFKREIAILRACRDPNIVSFLGASLQPDRTMLVTEYCDGGNLTRNLLAGRVNWYRRGKKIALDVARGLTYLHSRRIIHFDLKSPNILLARDGTAKISDVGMAKIMAREYSGVTGNVGTLAWAAPEMLLGARCTEKADIYSYGVVLWEICTCMTPVRGQLRDVGVPQECPADVRELILDCLATNPRKRPSAVEVVDRLRAMPEPKAVQTPAAAAAQATSRLQQMHVQEKRQQVLQQAVAGLSRLPNGSAAAQLAARTPVEVEDSPAPVTPATDCAALEVSQPAPVAAQQQEPTAAKGERGEREKRQGKGSSQRSSEESQLSMIDVDPTDLAGLAAVYASPVPGASLRAAQAAFRRATSSRPASVELPRRANSILLASLSKNHLPPLFNRLQSAPVQQSQQLLRVSSSPACIDAYPWEDSSVASSSPGGANSPVAVGVADAPGLGPRPPRPRRRSMEDRVLHVLAMPGASLARASGIPPRLQLEAPEPGAAGATTGASAAVAAAAGAQPLVQQLAKLQQRLRPPAEGSPVSQAGGSRATSLEQADELSRVAEEEESEQYAQAQAHQQQQE